VVIVADAFVAACAGGVAETLTLRWLLRLKWMDVVYDDGDDRDDRTGKREEPWDS
jgi:hypothetical protein